MQKPGIKIRVFIVWHDPGTHVREKDMRQSAGELDVRLGDVDILSMVFSCRYEIELKWIANSCQHFFQEQVKLFPL